MRDFGDLSYLLRPAFEAKLAAQIAAATRVTLPPGLPLGAKGLPVQGGAIPWMKQLQKDTAHVLLYTREEYQTISRPLGIWLESPRGTHNGTIALHVPGGATLLLADRRRSPCLREEERWRPQLGGRNVVAAAGKSCHEACAAEGGSCVQRELEWANTCEALSAAFPCEAGCGHQVGPELPAYAVSPSLDTHRQCLISDIAISKCEAKYGKTSRLCRCVFESAAVHHTSRSRA